MLLSTDALLFILLALVNCHKYRKSHPMLPHTNAHVGPCTVAPFKILLHGVVLFHRRP